MRNACFQLIDPNCNRNFDYSYKNYTKTSFVPLQYDNSNNVQLCNIPNASISLATTHEQYLHQKLGACAGISTDIYIPPGNVFVPPLTYLTPSYVIQSIIEEILVKSFSEIPVYTSTDCHFAFRKYFCGSYL